MYVAVYKYHAPDWLGPYLKPYEATMHMEELTIFPFCAGLRRSQTGDLSRKGWLKGHSDHDEFAEVRPSDDGPTLPKSFEDMSPPCAQRCESWGEAVYVINACNKRRIRPRVSKDCPPKPCTARRYEATSTKEILQASKP
jgi:hypothetical protein